ncbi:O-antigen ligase family protein [Streptomyces olivochromogenes]|uniref:O-antigen ligase family protein n=1 Tax=Streptomyces olivochromogenes TaxID=1963 RepID=UPI001F422D05|nr:O-antigen ligase family protein [Streptomyces olivochromogenes]MCF3130202.1 O-antigen ligase family protein [Streptomyces olivochromogenes]
MSGVIALDWISSMGGSEKVRDVMVETFPDAEVRRVWNDGASLRHPTRVVRESRITKTPLMRSKATYKRRSNALAWGVGATAALIGVQFAHVHVFTVVTVFWLLSAKAKPGRWGVAIGLGLAVIPVAITALTGDLVNNATLGLQLLALAGNAIMIAAKSDRDDRRLMLYGVLSTSTLASVVALIQVSGVPGVELWHHNISSLGRPQGIYPEPDWLGLFGAIGLVLAWRMLPRSTLRNLVLALNAATLALAFARAAWVGLAAAVVLHVAFSLVGRRRESRQAKSRTVPTLLFLVAFAGVGLAASPGLRTDLTARAQSIFFSNASDVSGRARVQQAETLIQLAETAPWFGHGISASGRVGVSGIYDPRSENSVGSNWVLSLWVDAKYLAAPLILLLIGAAAASARTVAGQGLAVVVVNNLFSNASFSPITWLLLGLVLAARSVPVSDQPEHDAVDGEQYHTSHERPDGVSTTESPRPPRRMVAHTPRHRPTEEWT